jgi:hypothetical protein
MARPSQSGFDSGIPAGAQRGVLHEAYLHALFPLPQAPNSSAKAHAIKRTEWACTIFAIALVLRPVVWLQVLKTPIIETKSAKSGSGRLLDRGLPRSFALASL